MIAKSRLLGIIISVLVVSLTANTAVQAASLKTAPTSYQQAIPPSAVVVGAVDVTNPTDETLALVTQIKAFRQINTSGDIEFYDEANLAKAITPDLSEFSLGPRESLRVFFKVDGRLLPSGGVYAAILVRSQAGPEPQQSSAAITNLQTASLLILDNGGSGEKRGTINKLTVSWLQLGGGISGSVVYANSGQSAQALAFNPQLQVRATPWGKASTSSGPLVFPGNQRELTVNKTGSYLGILPLTIDDPNSQTDRVAWVLAITGYWRWLLPLLLLAGLGIVAIVKIRRQRARRFDYV